MGPKEDPELQRQIEANEGIFEPLLLEPHPENRNKFRIIDGDRRWTNSKILVEVQKKEQYKRLPAEITDKTLSDEERLRVWIYIHRQRREWDTKEKEMVAYSLVNMVGRASAANILGITVRELDKLVEIYDLSEKLTNLAEPGASITWATEIKNLNRKILTPTVLDTIIKKVNEQEITNSKDLRKLRQILKDPVGKEKFPVRRGQHRERPKDLGSCPVQKGSRAAWRHRAAFRIAPALPVDNSSCNERGSASHSQVGGNGKADQRAKEGAFQMTNKHEDTVRNNCWLVLEAIRVNRDAFGGLR